MSGLPPPPDELLEGAALFLDFDGTLVELAETPAAINVPESLGPLLEGLRDRLGGRLAIVSGRSLADLHRHLGCDGIPLSGSHGQELRFADGTARPLTVPDGLAELAKEVGRFAETAEGLLVEEKATGVALHFRQAPAQADRARKFMRDLAFAHGLQVQAGNMVVELRPQGATKGDVVRLLMAEPPFADARPVFVGDDLTDEHAFAAAADLGGAGVLVGEPRKSAARYRLRSVEAVAAWLSGPS
jgi:trehalose 6-phosphate phosphatase